MKEISRRQEKIIGEEKYNQLYYYYREKFENSKINNLTLEQRKKLHPILLSAIKLMNKLNGYDIQILNDNRTKTSRPIIYAVTHIGKSDIEVVTEAINAHYYLLSGDFESLYKTLAGTVLGMNGVLYFKENDKLDRHKVKDKMISTLNQGGHILYFPEGTWNLSPELPVLPLYKGIVDIASETNAIIVPIAIEQYDKKFIVNIGQNFDVENLKREYNQMEILTQLRDVLATLKWQIWQCTPIQKRYTILENAYQDFIDSKIGEWPDISIEDFHNAVFKDKNISTYDEVFAPIYKLRDKR